MSLVKHRQVQPRVVHSAFVIQVHYRRDLSGTSSSVRGKNRFRLRARSPPQPETLFISDSGAWSQQHDLNHLHTARDETPKPNSEIFNNCQNILVATPQMALEAASKVAISSGVRVPFDFFKPLLLLFLLESGFDLISLHQLQIMPGKYDGIFFQ